MDSRLKAALKQPNYVHTVVSGEVFHGAATAHLEQPWPERCGVPGAKSTLFLSALQGTRILQLPVGQTQRLPAPGWRV